MVATSEGLSLTQAHDLAQAKVTAQALQAATLAFRGLLDPRDLDRSFPAYAKVVETLLKKYRGDSAGLAKAYYAALRQVEGVKAPMPEVPMPVDLAPAQAATSLLVTGPVAVKSKVARGMPVEDAVGQALQMTLGAVSRHVQNGGREFLQGAVKHDPHASGWTRRSGGHACSFCAMLISRGPVYRSEATSSFRTHDHCHCAAVPFFGGSGWTAQAAEYQDLWVQATKGASGPEAARRRFQAAYEARYGAETLTPADVHANALADHAKRPKAAPAPAAPTSVIDRLPRQNRPVPEDAVDVGVQQLHDARAVNPGYGTDRAYGVNCVHVANALELRRRGFDVTATPLPSHLGTRGRNADEALQRWTAPDGSKHGRHLWPMTVTEVKKETESWPVGARGWIRVSWKRDFGGGGHIWNVEKMPDGSVRWMDGQPGVGIVDPQDYKRRAQAGRAWSAVRVDDLVPTDHVQEFIHERPA